MKKAFLTVLLMGVALHVFAQSGVIRELSGEVELRHAGAADFVAAYIGSEVRPDTVVSTGFRSTAVVEIGSSTLTVRPLTRLSLEEIRIGAGTENLSVNLQAGRVRVDVRPPAGTMAEFTMQGPNATASVRGTSFDMDVSSVSVMEGTVSFAGGRGMPVLVHAGGESAVVAGGRAADPAQTVFQNLSPPLPAGVGSSGEVITVPVTTAPVAPGTGNIIITIR